MELKAFLKSTKVMTTCNYFDLTPSINLLRVTICATVDLPGWKPFWLILRSGIRWDLILSRSNLLEGYHQRWRDYRSLRDCKSLAWKYVVKKNDVYSCLNINYSCLNIKNRRLIKLIVLIIYVFKGLFQWIRNK